MKRRYLLKRAAHACLISAGLVIAGTVVTETIEPRLAGLINQEGAAKVIALAGCLAPLCALEALRIKSPEEELDRIPEAELQKIDRVVGSLSTFRDLTTHIEFGFASGYDSPISAGRDSLESLQRFQRLVLLKAKRDQHTNLPDLIAIARAGKAQRAKHEQQIKELDERSQAAFRSMDPADQPAVIAADIDQLRAELEALHHQATRLS